MYDKIITIISTIILQLLYVFHVTEVVADNVSFTGERREQNNNGYGNNNGYNNNNGYGNYNQAPQQSYNQAPVQQQQPASYSNGTSSDFEEMPLDDDLPF